MSRYNVDKINKDLIDVVMGRKRVDDPSVTASLGHLQTAIKNTPQEERQDDCKLDRLMDDLHETRQELWTGYGVSKAISKRNEKSRDFEVAYNARKTADKVWTGLGKEANEGHDYYTTKMLKAAADQNGSVEP